jgi:hypothetical protein
MISRMMKMILIFCSLAMVLSAEAINDCSIHGILHNRVIRETKSHHQTLVVTMPRAKHQPRANDIRKAEEALLEFSSKYNATMEFRMRTNESQTAWVLLDNVRTFEDVQWLRDTLLWDVPLRDVVIEHRVLLANGTLFAESHANWNTTSSLNDLSVDNFSRSLLWGGWKFAKILCLTVVLFTAVGSTTFIVTLELATTVGGMATGAGISMSLAGAFSGYVLENLRD